MILMIALGLAGAAIAPAAAQTPTPTFIPTAPPAETPGLPPRPTEQPTSPAATSVVTATATPVVTSVVTATPVATVVPTTTPPISGTGKLNPVAIMISLAFDVPVEEVVALHESGYGFGNITKIYAYTLSGRSVEEIVALRESGMGWGEIRKEYGLPPGQPRPNLGQIMSGRYPITGTISDTVGLPPGQARKVSRLTAVLARRPPTMPRRPRAGRPIRAPTTARATRTKTTASRPIRAPITARATRTRTKTTASRSRRR
jgi:hypothetical protein